MKQSPLLTLFFTIFLDMLGVGILIPIIPILFTDSTSVHYLLPAHTSVEWGYVLLGITFALYSVGQFIASPIIGQFSDKLGRKKLLIASILGTSVGHMLFALGILFHVIPLLLFARLFSGISAGNIVVAQAAIADITTPENRAKNFGLIGAAFGIGFVVGPFLGGKLADPSIISWFSATTPFWFAAFLSLTNAVLVSFFLKETNKHTKEGSIEWGRSVKNIARALGLKSVRPLFVTNFLFQMGFSFYMTFSTVFLLYRFGFTEGTIGNYFAYVGLWIVFTQAFMTRLMSKYFTEVRILRNTIITTGIAISVILMAPQASWLYFIVPFFAMSIGLTQSNMTALISRSVGPSIQGEILGINGSLNALAMTIPPLISGVIAAIFKPEAPLMIASTIIILSGLYFINHLRGSRVVLD